MPHGLHATGLGKRLLLLEVLLKLLQTHAQLVHRLCLALQHSVETYHVALHTRMRVHWVSKEEMRELVPVCVCALMMRTPK